ncbi:ferrous iron transport protein A [Geomonas sp. Red32]|uniref:FeoA family protein n=1 Tax=Geomonas sp. Red32 TaxID=2912856 RepID=UPI00202CF1CE|nr:FeoA family protein [Geomonas sp. Red32]MCM0080669.1 ferrous iron transport protein A [Geomonas sp. Red32]
MMPLVLLEIGEVGEIVEVRTVKAPFGESACDCRVEEMGLRVGKSVEMLRNCGGPILLKVDESRLAVDRSLAMKIMVKGAGR